MCPDNEKDAGSAETTKESIKKQIQDNKSELKNISRQLLKARDMSEQRYLKQRQKEIELQIMRLNAQLKETT